MSKKLLGKIDKLLEKLADPAYPEDLDDVKGWRKQVEIEMIKKDLSRHEAVKLMIRKIKDDLDDINEVLLDADSEQLPDKKRDRMLDQKKFYVWFLGFFGDSDKIIKSIENDVDEELKE